MSGSRLESVTVLTLVGAMLFAGPVAAAGEEDPWKPLAFLQGRWEGEGSSFGKATAVTHTYERVIGDRFLHLRTRSVSEQEVHEDWGFFSYDPERETLVLRQFLSEGFVNTYLLETGAEGRALTLTTESTEGAGGTRARLTYDVRSEREYEMTLELAPPGKDWFRCQTMVMTRVD